jgi:DNA-binding transcriptional regulator YhcF (GntR family)
VIVEVDTTNPTPPYEQIRSQLARMIGTGVLAAETQLPPIRQLAADLGLAANTVARAYHELELEGLVRSRVRHGTTVVHPQRTLSRAAIDRTLTEAARAYVTVARQLGVDDDAATAAVRGELKRR